MRLFSALLDIALLPVVIVKDVVCAIPDMASLKEPMGDTRSACAKIDNHLRY